MINNIIFNKKRDEKQEKAVELSGEHQAMISSLTEEIFEMVFSQIEMTLPLTDYGVESSQLIRVDGRG